MSALGGVPVAAPSAPEACALGIRRYARVGAVPAVLAAQPHHHCIVLERKRGNIGLIPLLLKGP
jgi:hypothetical protein